ncbi:MAG: glycosyltransferase family 39 protein [Gemmatimonadaceae bacterium]|nr:glycosyltransferase family 39 protein [Gemmatimonadaceae bacterium]
MTQRAAVATRDGEVATVWWLAAVCLVGIAVRAAFLTQPMRQDEADTVVLFALTPVRHILVDTVIPNNHILHSLLVKGSVGVLGLDPIAVRAPAFLAACLVLPLTWAVGRAFYNARAGVIGAAIVAVSAPMVLYATNARGYSLIAVAMLLALLALRTALEVSSVRSWGLFAVAAAAGAFVNPSMLYPVGGMVVWAALEIAHRNRAERMAGWRSLALACVASGAMSLVSYAPAIRVSGWRSVVSNDYVRPMSWESFLRALGVFVGDIAGYLGAGWPVVLQLVAPVALVAGWVLHRRLSRDRWPVSLAMLAWAVALLLVMRRPPFFRVWVFLVPVFAVTAGAAIDAALARLRVGRAATVAGLTALFIALGAGAMQVMRQAPRQLTETGLFPDGAAVADWLAVRLRPDDLIAAQFRAQGPVDFYLRERGVRARFVVNGDSVPGRLFIIPSFDNDETARSVVESRRLRGVDPTRLREVVPFDRSAIWALEDSR